ncbi:MAG: carotenoid biosynthesis protein [Leptospirillia bacterium]
MGLLLSTLLFRWYVFFFWGVGLVALSRATGALGGLLRFSVAWGVAYLFEWSSARPGGWFPFGHYQYLPTTKGREIWLGILPLMDSLSFAFLAVGALGMAGLAVQRSLGEILAGPGWLWRRLFPVAVLLFTAIDMVIDPVALRGSRWFLGQIYDYPDGGAYFGVTLSNFVGWAVTGATILVLWRLLPFRGENREDGGALNRLLPPFLYLSVYLFNLAVALWLREWGIVSADILLALLAGALLFRLRRGCPSRRESLRNASID